MRDVMHDTMSPPGAPGQRPRRNTLFHREDDPAWRVDHAGAAHPRRVT